MKTRYKPKYAANPGKSGNLTPFLIIGGVALLVLVIVLAAILLGSRAKTPGADHPGEGTTISGKPSAPSPSTNPTDTTPSDDPQASLPPDTPEDPTEEPTEEPIPEVTIPPFSPHYVESTDPALHLLSTDVMVGDEIVTDYHAEEEIFFDEPAQYTDFDGLITFRGDNFRTGSSVGTAELSSKTFGSSWSSPISSLVAPDGNRWSGCGWTGQPLIANWPKETRAIMNMHDWAKEQDELIEVVYPTMDGHIYFLELTTGKATREPLFMGFTFKGTGSLDPRGYPVLYVGAGYESSRGPARVFAISLIDGSTLFTFGNKDKFAHRAWPCFDSAPLIDAETDQLIYPGENGVLYIVKLNSQYDESAGTLTMEPEFIRWRYRGVRSSRTAYYLGFEGSASIYQGHIFLADNGGYLICLDLNDLKVEWMQDILDDTNASVVMELEDGHPYLYIAPSFHLGWRSWSTAEVPIFKIDAETGEIVWQKAYTCRSESGVSGGVQGTIALGQNNLSNMIYVPVARTGTASGGIVAALNKQTGEVIWEWKGKSYTWCSPTLVYDQNGDGYLIFATLQGTLYMVDGATGETLDTFDMRGHMEATVGAYGNTIVVGARTGRIWGITLE